MTIKIYFYAQALDNQTKDDIYYAEFGSELRYCENTSTRQYVPMLMSQIIEHSKIKSEIDKLKGFVEFKQETKTANILIEFDTNKKDELGRTSHNILVLENASFDINSQDSHEKVVKNLELEKYINSFLQQTGRGNFGTEFYNIAAILEEIKKKKRQAEVIKYLIPLAIVVGGLSLSYLSLK